MGRVGKDGHTLPFSSLGTASPGMKQVSLIPLLLSKAPDLPGQAMGALGLVWAAPERPEDS